MSSVWRPGDRRRHSRKSSCALEYNPSSRLWQELLPDNYRGAGSNVLQILPAETAVSAFSAAGPSSADYLHAHSWHSGRAGHLRFLKARDCYSEPNRVQNREDARHGRCHDHGITIPSTAAYRGSGEPPERRRLLHQRRNRMRLSRRHTQGLFTSVRMTSPEQNSPGDSAAPSQRARGHRLPSVRRGFLFAQPPVLFFKGSDRPLQAYLDFALSCFPAFEVRNGTAMLSSHNRRWRKRSPWRCRRRPRHSDRRYRRQRFAQPCRHRRHIYADAGIDPRGFLDTPARRPREAGRTRHGGVWRAANGEILPRRRQLLGIPLRRGTTWIYPGNADCWALAFSGVTMPFEFLAACRGGRARSVAKPHAWSGAPNRVGATHTRLVNFDHSPMPADIFCEREVRRSTDHGVGAGLPSLVFRLISALEARHAASRSGRHSSAAHAASATSELSSTELDIEAKGCRDPSLCARPSNT